MAVTRRPASACGALIAAEPAAAAAAAKAAAALESPPPPLPAPRRRRPPPPPPLPPPSSFAPSTAAARGFRFEVVHRSRLSGARAGLLHTPHGTLETPAFVPVATTGALKCVSWADADAAGTTLAFVNTLHCMLQPGGAQAVADAGGLHGLTGRHRAPFITDSGGFQVFSLRHGGVAASLAVGAAAAAAAAASAAVPDEAAPSLKRAAPRGRRPPGGGGGDGAGPSSPPRAPPPSLVLRVDEGGVLFRSYRDGSLVHLTPTGSVAAQQLLGADIILPLDELPAHHVDHARLEAATARSHRWAAAGLAAHQARPGRQAMYGILHGGTDGALRAASAAYLCALPFDGLAIGGSLGANRGEAASMLAALLPLLLHQASSPPSQPRPIHLLGVGDEAGVRAAVALGVDTTDASWPTRAGRHGTLLTSRGALSLRSVARTAGAARAAGPPDPGCGCAVCARHSLGYLAHLWRAREPVAGQLAALHNLARAHTVCRELRADILAGRL